MENETNDPDSIASGELHQKIQRAQQLHRRMTQPEKLLWKKLRANRLCGAHFRRQTNFHGFIVDFYCPWAQLVIELDGPVDEDRREYDQWRDGILMEIGLRVMRFTSEQICSDMPKVLEAITEALMSFPSHSKNGPLPSKFGRTFGERHS
jgi:very-short-patch-repair endonuclease